MAGIGKEVALLRVREAFTVLRKVIENDAVSTHYVTSVLKLVPFDIIKTFVSSDEKIKITQKRETGIANGSLRS